MTVFKLPPWVELQVNIFLTCDEAAMQIKLKGLKAFSTEITEHLDVPSLLKLFDTEPPPGDWRVMTPDEIKEYKRENDE